MRYRIFYIIFCSLVLMTLPVTRVSAQDALFDKYEDTNGVSTVYISKTMLGMIPNVEAGGHDVGKMASRLDQLRILTCEKPSVIPRLLEDARSMYKSNGYEIIMKMNDDGEKVTIYQRKLKDNKNEFVLLTEEKAEITIINVKGNITIRDIQQFAGQ